MHYSPSLVVTQQTLIDPNLPRICWVNYVSTTNVAATSETELSPITNIANPSTAFGWEGSNNAQQDIDITLNGIEIDYVGIARHNLEGAAAMRIQALVDGTYSTIIDWTTNLSNQSTLFLLNSAAPKAIRISIKDNITAPKIAVIYIGKSTVLQRSIYVGHTPITMGRNQTEVGGLSQSGQYLGTLVTKEYFSTSVSLRNLTPSWYRLNLDPFVNRNQKTPFFWSWRPEKYPNETGYCWLSDTPRPSNDLSNGMMKVSLSMEGIV